MDQQDKASLKDAAESEAQSRVGSPEAYRPSKKEETKPKQKPFKIQHVKSRQQLHRSESEVSLSHKKQEHSLVSESGAEDSNQVKPKNPAYSRRSQIDLKRPHGPPSVPRQSFTEIGEVPIKVRQQPQTLKDATKQLQKQDTRPDKDKQPQQIADDWANLESAVHKNSSTKDPVFDSMTSPLKDPFSKLADSGISPVHNLQDHRTDTGDHDPLKDSAGAFQFPKKLDKPKPAEKISITVTGPQPEALKPAAPEEPAPATLQKQEEKPELQKKTSIEQKAGKTESPPAKKGGLTSLTFGNSNFGLDPELCLPYYQEVFFETYARLTQQVEQRRFPQEAGGATIRRVLRR